MRYSFAVALVSLICVVDGHRSREGKSGILECRSTRTVSRIGTMACRPMGRMQRQPTRLAIPASMLMGSSLRVAAKDNPCAPTSVNNGRRMEPDAKREAITDILNTGWLRLASGEIDVIINRRIVVESELPMVVRVVDLFCIGDVYKVMVVEGDRYRVLGETNSVKSDNCKTTTVDPDAAWEDGFWSRGEFVLDPGRYTIVLAAVSSPYGGGTFALRVDEEEDVIDEYEDDEEEDDDEVTLDDADESVVDESGSGSNEWTEAKRVQYRTNNRKRSSRRPRSTRSTKGRRSVRRTKSRQSASNRKTHTGITRRSTKTNRSKTRSKIGIASIREVCIGVNGFVVVNKAVPATRIDAICKKYDWSAAQLSSAKSVKRAAITTLNRCVEPKSTVWIGGYNQHDPKNFFGATLSSVGQVEINTWDRDLLLPVMCFVDDQSSLE